ncbi:MAG: DUF2288 domain-containing protein [Gammaproteobacteria bacterium]|nr:DUF2288 domain-containing protein [Gammaproteobacteria bacterium]
MADTELRIRLNAETGKLAWKELERFFARGVVIVAAPDLDLVDVAARMVEDDSAAIQRWIGEGRLARANERQARDWSARAPTFWAVVAAPWVLVQEVTVPVVH